MFISRACVPGGGGRASLGRALPPQGRLPGSPADPNYKAHLLAYDPRCMSKIDVDFDVVFCSFWGRFRIPLGGLMGPWVALIRPKLVPTSSSKRLVFEKVVFHETLRFSMLFGVFGLHMAPPNRPRSLQDGSWIVLGRFVLPLHFSI